MLMLAGAAIGAAASIWGGEKAEDAARNAAREQAKLTTFRRDEEMRQKKIEFGGRRSAMTAGVYSSNLQNTGTSQSYLQTAFHEDMRQLAWQDRADKMEAEAIRNGADGVGDSMKIAGVSSAISAAVGAGIEEWG